MILGSAKKSLQDLKDKTEAAAHSDLIQRIEVEDSGLLSEIAGNFNTIAGKLKEAQDRIKILGKIEKENQELSESVDSYRNSLDHLSVIGELGQQITSSLSASEIFDKLAEILESILDASVILLGISDNKKKIKYFRKPESPNSTDIEVAGNEKIVAEWSIEKQMEVFLNDAEKDYRRYFFDPVITMEGLPVKSLFCYPMVINNETSGVLCIFSYRQDAFNTYHQSMIRSLMAYINVAVDNARVYEELKATQSQLVQSEKMASLGQLTAGVAHEINNPINFVSAGIETLKNNYSEIKGLLEFYLQLKPGENNDELLSKIEKIKKEIEIDALLDEIEDLYRSIKNGATRTTEIVKNLRNFTRLDENEFKLANLEEGLDSTLVILNSQMKDRIKIIKDYAKLPLVNCFPGQLNQVFINILNNASQAIDGPGTIWIKTQVNDGFAEIIIRDSGSGMSDEVKNRIFDPFFTTKDVGIGTGLGLSISYGIIEKHKGQIIVDSEPGKGTQFTIRIPLNLN